MRFGNRGSRSDARRYAGFWPRRETLEDRLLLAIDLGGSLPPALPNVATTVTGNSPPGPFGVVEGGAVQNGGAGYAVTDLGDVNNDGFDDFFIGAPSVTTNTVGNVVQGGTAIPSAYLVYGSLQANATTVQNVDWLTLNTTGQRVGDLGQLGVANGTQTNPITGAPGFAYSGLRFITSTNPTSMLGASVSVVRNVGGVAGTNALLIGAPGGADENGANPGTGRAYLVYTNAALNALATASATTGVTQTVDLDNPALTPGIIVVTFENNTPGGRTGASVASITNVFANGQPSIAIGAPGATVVNSGLINSGAVYLISGTAIPTTSQVIDLQNVGQTVLTTPTPVAGVLFLGSVTAGLAGFSLADAGNVNGALSGTTPITDMLIGAPGTGSGGTAYLVYGSTTLITQPTGNFNNLFFISLATLGTGVSSVNGAIFNGLPAGSNTGFSVASAGDFNEDGFGDIMIGSPGNGIPSLPGQVNLIYGQAQTTSSSGISGVINLSSPPSNIEQLTLNGPSAGSLAGYAMSSLGRMVASTSFPDSEILIGAPGFNGNQGAVYLIPADPITLLGTFTLSDGTQPVAATEITITNTAGAPFLGASISGGTVATGQTTTADGDALSDFIIGAPGYNVTGVTSGTGNRTLAGGAFILEGAFIPLSLPLNVQITTEIGVGIPISTTGVFTVNAAANALAIFVFSNAAITPPFAPVTQINPRSIVVNGVAFPNATLAQDPVDENKDGIPDAIITIAPLSALGLTTSSTTLTITGVTLATGPNANKSWGGSASILVTGAPGPPITTVGTGLAPVAVPLALAVAPQFGPDVYVPTLAALSAYNYAPIPLGVALNQYLPPTAFRNRIEQYFFPKKYLNQFGSRHEESAGRTSTLGRAVFTRNGKKAVTFTHKVRVVPTQDQTQTTLV